MTSQPTSSAKFPGSGCSAVKHQPTSQTQTSQPTPEDHSGTDSSAPKHQSTNKLESHRPHTDQLYATDRPMSSDPVNTGSPVLHRSRQNSISSLSSEAGSELSDRPLLDLYVKKGNYQRIKIRLSPTRTGPGTVI